MRILILCHRFPYPPNKGDRIRSFHLIRHLASRHDVHILSLLDRQVARSEWQELERFCYRVEGFELGRSKAMVRCSVGLLSGRSLTHCFFDSSKLRHRVRELCGQGLVDLVLAVGSGMAQFTELETDVPKLLDIVDVDSSKWSQYARRSRFPKSLVFRLEARRLRRYESHLSQTFDHVIGTTQKEIDLLRTIDPQVRATVIRNGVDLEAFRDLDGDKTEHPSLLFIGQMDYFANVDAVVEFSERVFPTLRRSFPGLTFDIVGRCPSPEVLNLARLDGVRVVGEVDRIQPYLSRAWVFLAPLRIAQGVQNKVLEAMAASVPTVVSDAVMEGLKDGEFDESRDLCVARDSKEMASAVLSLLSDEQRRFRMASSAAKKLEARYQWSCNLEELDDLIEQLVGTTCQQSQAASRLVESLG